MLLQFNFENFLSFRDSTTLDLTAAKITEFPDHVISECGEKILPVTAIYGANASGKSNVQEAFNYMATYVIESFAYGGEKDKKQSEPKFIPPVPFLFDNTSKEAESSFEVYFTAWKGTAVRYYNYGFTIGRDGIHEEWLNTKAKTAKEYKRIFYRNGEELELPGIPAKGRDNIKVALEKETLVVSLGAKLKIEQLKFVRDWFYFCEIADFGDPRENLSLSMIAPSSFAKSRERQQQVVRFFSAFDSSIIGFEVKKHETNPDQIQINSVHRVISSDDTAAIPFRYESAGTLKMFAMYPLLEAVLRRGSVLFVDELNARLHPLLVRAILILFLDPKTNPNHAQLIFTTHDVWHLNLLRRDEVWLLEKNEDGLSSLYSLVDFEDENGDRIRKDENYIKNYLLGKYGAIPIMQKFDLLGEE